MEGGTVGNTKITFKDYLKEKIDAIKEVKNEKRAIQDKLDEIQDKINKYEEQRQALRKNLNKDYKNPAEIS